MRKFVHVIFLACLTLSLSLVAQEDSLGHLPAFVEKGMAQWHVPGLAVVMVTDEEVLFQQGFGSTSAVDGKKVDTHTLAQAPGCH